jgi:hypothetical protein
VVLHPHDFTVALLVKAMHHPLQPPQAFRLW